MLRRYGEQALRDVSNTPFFPESDADHALRTSAICYKIGRKTYMTASVSGSVQASLIGASSLTMKVLSLRKVRSASLAPYCLADLSLHQVTNGCVHSPSPLGAR